MDITKIPRALIYEEKVSLDYFDVDLEGTIDFIMYNELLTMKNIDAGYEISFNEMCLLLFNDVYFIVTSVLLDDRPEQNFNYYIKLAGRLSNEILLSLFENPIKQKCVLVMVCAILNKNFPNKKSIFRFLKQLGNWIQTNNSNLLYDKLITNSTKPNSYSFLPCALKQEILENVNWEDVTIFFDSHGDFMQQECDKVVNKLGKDDKEKIMIICSMFDYFKKMTNEKI